MKKIINTALINSLATTAYISLVASLFFTANTKNWNIPEPNILIPIFMLSLFVFSAALTGSLILGRPILWYIDGKKKEALLLLAYTLGIFFLTTLIIFAILILASR